MHPYIDGIGANEVEQHRRKVATNRLDGKGGDDRTGLEEIRMIAAFTQLHDNVENGHDIAGSKIVLGTARKSISLLE